MADQKVSAADVEKVKDDHEAAGKPLSPTEDPTDHSKSASEIAAQVDLKGESGATVNAKNMEAVSKDDETKEEKAEEDQTIVGKIRRSQLFFVRNHVSGQDYVGISPQNDPKATPAEKRLSSVFPLDGVSPRTGIQIVPKDGDPFSVGDGYGPDKTPADWAGVNRPDGKPLFA